MRINALNQVNVNYYELKIFPDHDRSIYRRPSVCKLFTFSNSWITTIGPNSFKNETKHFQGFLCLNEGQRLIPRGD